MLVISSSIHVAIFFDVATISLRLAELQVAGVQLCMCSLLFLSTRDTSHFFQLQTMAGNRA